jgi:hypothetical protein
MISENRLKKISDEKEILNLFQTCTNDDDRLTILQFITDEKFLVKILRLTDNDFIKHETILKIKNQTVLKKIAINNMESDLVRTAAIRQINDEKFLQSIAFNSSIALKREIICKINDQELLYQLYQETSDDICRKRIVERLDDNNILSEILYSHENSLLIKSYAVKRLNNIDELVKHRLTADIELNSFIVDRLSELNA